MKICFAFRLSLFAVCGSFSPLFAQSSTPPPLGLLRLRSAPTASVPSVVATNKFSVDDLTPGTSGGSKTQKQGVDCLVLGAQQTWTRPLRGTGQNVVFVSFSLYASLSTTVRVGGAWLAIAESPGLGYAQLMAGQSGSNGIDWKPLGIHLMIDSYETRLFAALSVITVRLNPATSTWDIFSGSSLIAEDLPFYTPAGQTNSPDFVVQAGSPGVWVTGLVMSDENPLYVDANANSIADSFEQQQNGSLLPANAPASTHHALAQAWRDYNRGHSMPALFVKRILPDH